MSHSRSNSFMPTPPARLPLPRPSAVKSRRSSSAATPPEQDPAVLASSINTVLSKLSLEQITAISEEKASFEAQVEHLVSVGADDSTLAEFGKTFDRCAASVDAAIYPTVHDEHKVLVGGDSVQPLTIEPEALHPIPEHAVSEVKAELTRVYGYRHLSDASIPTVTVDRPSTGPVRFPLASFPAGTRSLSESNLSTNLTSWPAYTAVSGAKHASVHDEADEADEVDERWIIGSPVGFAHSPGNLSEGSPLSSGPASPRWSFPLDPTSMRDDRGGHPTSTLPPVSPDNSVTGNRGSPSPDQASITVGARSVSYDSGLNAATTTCPHFLPHPPPVATPSEEEVSGQTTTDRPSLTGHRRSATFSLGSPATALPVPVHGPFTTTHTIHGVTNSFQVHLPAGAPPGPTVIAVPAMSTPVLKGSANATTPAAPSSGSVGRSAEAVYQGSCTTHYYSYAQDVHAFKAGPSAPVTMLHAEQDYPASWPVEFLTYRFPATASQAAPSMPWYESNDASFFASHVPSSTAAGSPMATTIPHHYIRGVHGHYSPSRRHAAPVVPVATTVQQDGEGGMRVVPVNPVGPLATLPTPRRQDSGMDDFEV